MLNRVSKEAYALAVEKLVDLAMWGTGGSRVAAQVLLSAYDGYNYQLDIAGMCNLDSYYHVLAMAVIQGRYDTGLEPHSLLENGDKIFERLWHDWYALHVDERGKVTCRVCDGRGVVYSDDNDEEGRTCPSCRGKRRVCSCGH